MTVFDTFAAALDADVDALYGAVFEVAPQVMGSYGKGPDPQRAPFSVRAVLNFGRGATEDLGGTGREVWNATVAAQPVTLDVEVSRLPAGFSFREGDHVREAGVAQPRSFEVAMPAIPTSNRLLRLTLSRI